MPARKQPHCRSCGRPTAGHRRVSGRSVCPGEPLSPPDSPRLTSYPSPHEVSPLRVTTPISISEVEIPLSGVHHRRNPTWVDPPRRAPSTARGESLVPTEPFTEPGVVKSESAKPIDPWYPEDGNGYGNRFDEGGEDDDDDDSQSNASFRSRSSGSFNQSVLKAREPLASLFKVPRREVSRVADSAEKLGLHVARMRKPAFEDSREKRRLARAEREGSTSFMVLGKSGTAVRYLADLQRKAMPGAIEPEYERWGTVGMLQLVVAGAIGGLVVVYGLSLL